MQYAYLLIYLSVHLFARRCSDYHRARLRKIESHAAHLLAVDAASAQGGGSSGSSAEPATSRLTPEELAYARDFQVYKYRFPGLYRFSGLYRFPGLRRCPGLYKF